MKTTKLLSFVFIIVLCSFILTGCNKKIGIGSEKLFETYWGCNSSKAERISPEWIVIGDNNDGFALIDEKAGFSLVLTINNGTVEMVGVIYQKSSDNKKQAELMLDPPYYAICTETDGGFWGKGMMQYMCVPSASFLLQEKR